MAFFLGLMTVAVVAAANSKAGGVVVMTIGSVFLGVLVIHVVWTALTWLVGLCRRLSDLARDAVLRRAVSQQRQRQESRRLDAAFDD